VSRQYEAPQGEVEEILAGIWQELLRVERVGRQDNFFELGGHSLLAMQMLVRIASSFWIEIPIDLVFKFPNVRELSIRIEELQQSLLIKRLSRGGTDIEELLESLASMSEVKVRELLRELTMGNRN
jgi:acyl carrier protein